MEGTLIPDEPKDADEFQSRRPRVLRGRLQGKVFLIPSFITVVALFCGFFAVLTAIKGHYDQACLGIGLALLLDGMDGRVARRLNATSAFGREIDSLADIVAFGVAPSVLVYLWGFSSLAEDFGILIAFLFVACGATRLARFNVMSASPASGDSQKHFVGLPIPAAAVSLTTVVYFYPTPLANAYSMAMVMGYSVLISILMVSTFSYLSPKRLHLTLANVRQYTLIFSVVVALIWYNSRVLIPLGFLVYVLSGPAWTVWSRGQAQKAGQRSVA